MNEQTKKRYVLVSTHTGVIREIGFETDDVKEAERECSYKTHYYYIDREERAKGKAVVLRY